MAFSILFFIILTVNYQNVDFFNNCQQKTFFFVYIQIGIYVTKLYTSSTSAKFQSNIFIFLLCDGRKLGKTDDVTNKYACFGTYSCRT